MGGALEAQLWSPLRDLLCQPRQVGVRRPPIEDTLLSEEVKHGRGRDAVEIDEEPGAPIPLGGLELADESVGAEQSSFLTAGEQADDPGGGERFRLELGPQCRHCGHSAGVVVRAGDVDPAQLAFDQNAEPGDQYPVGAGEQPAAQRKPPNQRPGYRDRKRRSLGPDPGVRNGRKRRWNIRPLRELSRWQARQTVRAVSRWARSS